MGGRPQFPLGSATLEYSNRQALKVPLKDQMEERPHQMKMVWARQLQSRQEGRESQTYPGRRSRILRFQEDISGFRFRLAGYWIPLRAQAGGPLQT